MATRNETATTGGFDYERWFRYGSLLVAVLVIVQAGLAGRYFFFGKHVFLTIHEQVANVLFIISVVLAGLAARGKRAQALDGVDVALAGVLVLLIAAQIGLGYGGRDSQTAASLHWPNGVLITALTAILVGRALPHRAPLDRR